MANGGHRFFRPATPRVALPYPRANADVADFDEDGRLDVLVGPAEANPGDGNGLR